MQEAWGQAVAALDASGVAWSVVYPLETAAPMATLEILVDTPGVDEAHRALEGLGFAASPARSDRGDVTFFRFAAGTDQWLRLRVRTTLSFGPRHPVRTGVETGCLGRCRQRGGMPVLAPEDAFWVALLRCLLEEGYLSPENRAGLQRLAPEHDSDSPLTHLVDAYCPPGWDTRRVLRCVRDADWATLERAFTSPSAPMRPSIRTGLATAAGALRRSRHLRDQPGRGLTVALIGPDGAGKSTLAQDIRQSLPLSVRSVYMGMNRDSMATIARWQPLGIRVPSLVAALWWRYLVARYHSMRGRLVIFDRYPYEQRTSARHAGSLRERCGHWLLTHACPAPDMAIILDVPGDIMYLRKGEHSPAALEAMRGQLLSLGVPGQQIVDAARSRDEVRVDVVERIWRRYVAERSSRSGQAVHRAACRAPEAGGPREDGKSSVKP